MAIVLAAIAMILTTTTLRTALTIRILRACLIAVGSRPARQAEALAVHMVALGLVFAFALQTTVGPVQTRWAGVLTCGTHIARSANHFTRNMITGCIAWQR